MNVRLKVDRSRDVDSDGNLDSILFFGSSVVTVIDNFTDDLFPGHVLKSYNASYTGADAETAIASEAFSTLDSGGKRRDYLIGRDNTADDLVIDLRDITENIGGKSKTTDATRFTKADIIYNFDTTASASQDKITVKIDNGTTTQAASVLITVSISLVKMLKTPSPLRRAITRCLPWCLMWVM